MQAIDRAAKIDSKDLSTLAYYGLLLREKAKLEPDPEKVLEIQLEAQKWTEKAVALSKATAPPADAAASKPAN